MIRRLTLVAISMCGVLLAPASGFAQADQDSRCFPWQELRDGACVAKSTDAAPPGQSRQLTTTPRDDPPPTPAPPAPAPATPLGAAAPPVAAVPVPAPTVAILCEGGTATGTTCTCPDGYTLLPATSGSGGTCVRSNAENCRGGVLTVAGVCLCDGRVTMSGEIYALEFLGGKCVPKRCPDKTYLRDGKCETSTDTRFTFTCRTGYIPDDHIASSATGGLRCVPDPTFCAGDTKRKDGTCAKAVAAIRIACFEGRCICGPHADWVNYLCQCTAPYRNVHGVCMTGAAEADEKSQPELQSTEPSPKRKACPRGTVRSNSGHCVATRPRLPGAGEFGLYYQGSQRYRDYPGQQPDNMR